jgi:hypothetical protein
VGHPVRSEIRPMTLSFVDVRRSVLSGPPGGLPTQPVYPGTTGEPAHPFPTLLLSIPTSLPKQPNMGIS